MKRSFISLLICFVTYYSMGQGNYGDSLRAALSRTQKPIERFDLMNRLLEYGYISGESNPDSSYCIELLDIAQDLDKDSLLAIAYNQVGNNFFRNNGDLSRGLEYFFKGIPFAEAARDKRRLSSLYVDIAAIYYRLNNKTEELKYIQKAFACLPEKNSPLYYFMLAQVQYHLSNYFLSQGQPDSTLYYAQALGVTNLSLKSPLFEAATQGLIGQAYDKMDDGVLAEIHISRANALNDSIQYIWGKIEGKRAYIYHLLKNNNLAEAKKQALMLIDIGTQRNIYDYKRLAAAVLTTIYDKDHRTDSAYYYSRLESAMKDSVFNQDNLNKIQSLAFNERIRILEEEDRLADEAAQRRSNLQYALIALGIVTFIILFFILSHSIIVTEKWISFFSVLGLLIVFEFINLLVHPFLERVTHHSPVLMLAALVCIGALLVPLHHRMEKWATAKLVEKNKKIRLANAKKTIDQLEKDGPPHT